MATVTAKREAIRVLVFSASLRAESLNTRLAKLAARCPGDRLPVRRRAIPQPFNAKQGMLLSASPSMVGGNRGLWALRVPLEHLGFLDLVEAAKHYPCAKKAWIEFLGEHPNPAADRVE